MLPSRGASKSIFISTAYTAAKPNIINKIVIKLINFFIWVTYLSTYIIHKKNKIVYIIKENNEYIKN